MLFEHPEVALRDCEECQAWRFGHDGKIVYFEGEPIERDPRTLPCKMGGPYNGSACPRESPEADTKLSRENFMAYLHWKRCVAVNRFPRDSIVESNAVIIADVIARCELKRTKLPKS